MRVKCPQCLKEYESIIPIMSIIDLPDKPIQEIFPEYSPIAREQLITGICSDECWDNYLGCEPWPEINGGENDE